MKIKMTSIPVKDPNEAHKFYTEILGFQSLMHMPEAQIAVVVSPEQPEGTSLLLEPSVNTFYETFQKAARAKSLPILVLDSKDAQADYEKLKAKGVEFKTEPKKTEWGTMAMFDDTCGNYIQIHQDL